MLAPLPSAHRRSHPKCVLLYVHRALNMLIAAQPPDIHDAVFEQSMDARSCQAAKLTGSPHMPLTGTRRWSYATVG